MIEKELIDSRNTDILPLNYKLYEILLSINESAYKEEIIDFNIFIKVQDTLLNIMKKIYIK